MARGPSKAELALWEAAMRDVRRLRPRRSAPAPAPRPDPAPIAVKGKVSPSAKPQPAEPAPFARDVDRGTLDRLRRGQIVPEARIDLHGMTQAEAFPALIAFLANAAREGRRALLVITGKGPLNQGGGVLRRNVPAWLMASPLGPRILTVTSANRKHGGDGAFYVWLRRQRPNRPNT